MSLSATFSPTASLNNRSVFIIGATGFVGKVTLSMLLYRFPNIGKVYTTVRARGQEESEARFWNSVVTAPPFDPLRERYGAGFDDFIREKIVVVNGDVGNHNLGFSEQEAQDIAQNVDVVINSAGNVTFNPSLESALRTNVVGTQNVIAFARRMKRPALVHVSTCFVAGKRSGAVWESEEVTGYFPRKDELTGVEFSAVEEIKACEALASRVKEETKDPMQAARFREMARARLIEEGRDPDDMDAMGLAVARERKVWTRERLTELGIERAQFWGWDNIYTYTKSLGEQLVASEAEIVRTIVRPSIVESANEFPFPGWNEGFTTTAPLIFIALKGQTQIPVREDLILDITPVDEVASVMIAAAAKAIDSTPHLVYQAATGDSNPNDMKRIVGLLGLHKRQHFTEKDTGFRLVNQLLARMETKPVSGETFNRSSAPMLNAATKKTLSLLDRARPRWGGGRVSNLIDSAKRTVERYEELTHETTEAFNLFRPFMRENAYIFRADNVRELFASIPDEEKRVLKWSPEKIDWYDYWMRVHFPGLKKWVFPTLEEDLRRTPKRVHTFKDLIELFETSTKRYASRVAMRIERDGVKEQYTYADVRELATRAAGFFAAHHIKAGDKVLLIADNAPEWGMTYFGILKLGAMCVPVDPTSSLDEIINFTRSSDARAIVLSRELHEKHAALHARLNASLLAAAKHRVSTNGNANGDTPNGEANVGKHIEISNYNFELDAASHNSNGASANGEHQDTFTSIELLGEANRHDGATSASSDDETFQTSTTRHVSIFTFDEVFAMPDVETERARTSLLPARVTAQTIASLIFTSGTTGTPKAVMLTHKNYANMVSMLASVFEMDTTDGVLSVLPLHHTFEFSTGFLTPLSRGAQITYLPELSGEELNRAIKNGHVTGIVGVPAVWEALHRRIKSRLTEKGRWAETVVETLIHANSWLRNQTPMNWGRVVFFPIHQGMGGRLRYLISGGSALNENIKKDLHGLGFTILEGYGLTEAAPVITVVRPSNRLLQGSVGTPVPGVDVKIADADANGVGEVIARGANVMAGYYQNDDATKRVLRDRWLYTGDLGRLDADGNLYLVGRSKEIIIDSNGKNIYPDEIEELYTTSPYIKELSVVGLPDAESAGERVACMVVPDYAYDISLSRPEVRRRIEEHFRDVSSTLAFHKRVKVWHFSDEDLPRTATRKVKRREVVAAMLKLEEQTRTAHEQTSNHQATHRANSNYWLYDIIATVSNKPLSDIAPDTRVSELGFDSLMFVELISALENAGAKIDSVDTLNEVQTMRELSARVSPKNAKTTSDTTARHTDRAPRQDKADEIYVPSLVRTVGNKGLDFLQSSLYDRFFNTKYEGRENIPVHTNFIVAPNHASHLDMGLTKIALGEAGRDLVALAAADYFFDNKYKRAYMDNFTNLVPMERSGSLRQSLRHARAYLEGGYNALIFPEGTRSLDGHIAEFKPIIGYLALSCRVGILPVYLEGTHESMPKGSTFLHVFENRNLTTRIGRFLDIVELERMTHNMPRSEAYKLIAARAQHEVENLRDRQHRKFDADALRHKFRHERRKEKSPEAELATAASD